MKKRGQVTVFVILGIIIVAVIAIVIYIGTLQNQENAPKTSAESADLTGLQKEVDTLVNLCLETLSEEALYDAAEHNGYAADGDNNWDCMPGSGSFSLTAIREIHMPISIDLTFPGGIPDFSHNANVLMQLGSDPDDIENCLDVYINKRLPGCINLERFEEQGWDITPTAGTIEPKTELAPGAGTSFKLKIPRTFTKERGDGTSYSFSINDYSYFSDIDLLFFIDKVKELASRLAAANPAGTGNFDGIPETIRRNVYDTFDAEADFNPPSKYKFIYTISAVTKNDYFAIIDDKDTPSNKDDFEYIWGFNVATEREYCELIVSNPIAREQIEAILADLPVDLLTICPPDCSTDADCDDSDPNTQDTCVPPGGEPAARCRNNPLP